MYPPLIVLLLSLFLQTNGLAQRDSILLENSIQLKFETKHSENPFLRGALVLKVYLKNTTQNKIHILTNSCYGLERFFKIKNEDVILDSGIYCTIGYPEVQTFLPGEPIEFEVYLYFMDELPQEAIEIGLELVKIPEEAAEKNFSLYFYEKKEFEKFVFWKKIKGYSFSIKLPFLRI